MNKEELLKLANSDRITATDMMKFSKRSVLQDDGSFKIIQPDMNFWSKVSLKKGDVPNLKKDIDTTVGRVLGNTLLILHTFGPDIFPFPEESIDLDKMTTKALQLRMNGDKVTGEMINDLLNTAVWLFRFGNIILPSYSENIVSLSTKAKSLKKKLIEKYPEAIKEGGASYVEKIEKPIVKMIREELKDDPSFIMYEQDRKPNISNHLKQTIGVFSAIKDPTTGKSVVPSGNLSEGIDVKDYHLFANMNIDGSYKRAVGTQDGGAIVKSIYGSMHNIKADKKGSDCGSRRGKSVTITKDNVDSYIDNYIISGKNDILITLDNKDSFIGKTVKLRSPLYCNHRSDNLICNKCVGELPYKSNYLMVGNLTSRIGFNMVNISLKSFHDNTVKTTSLNPFDYMK